MSETVQDATPEAVVVAVHRSVDPVLKSTTSPAAGLFAAPKVSVAEAVNREMGWTVSVVGAGATSSVPAT